MMEIEQIEKLIDLLPKIVLYIAPGYITIALYRISKDGNIKDDKMTLVKSIFISYIYMAVVKLVLLILHFILYLILYLASIKKIPSLSLEGKNAVEAIVIAGMAFGVGIFITPILNSEKINNIMIKLHHTTITSNLISDIKGLAKDKKGVYLMVYLENEGIAYDGYLVEDRMNEEDRYIILDCYRKYIIIKQEDGYKLKVKYDHSTSHEDFTVICFEKITQIEFNVDELRYPDNQIS